MRFTLKELLGITTFVGVFVFCITWVGYTSIAFWCTVFLLFSISVWFAAMARFPKLHQFAWCVPLVAMCCSFVPFTTVPESREDLVYYFAGLFFKSLAFQLHWIVLFLASACCFHLPRMDQLSHADVKTRPLDAFETESLKRLWTDEDVVIQDIDGEKRMFGSLRAAQQCLECHSVQRGELIGAFSWVLRRE